MLLVRTLIENPRVNRETEYIHIDLFTIITIYIQSLYTLEHLHQSPNFSVVMLHIGRSEVLSDLLYRHIDSARLCARLSLFPARVLDYQPFKLTKRRPLHRTAILLANHKPVNDPIHRITTHSSTTDWTYLPHTWIPSEEGHLIVFIFYKRVCIFSPHMITKFFSLLSLLSFI